MYSSTSKVVSITTRVPSPPLARIRLVASRPSSCGMRTSIRIRSGCSWRQPLIASFPSMASPTTSMSGWALRIMRKPARTRDWSSTTRIRTRVRSLIPGWPSRHRLRQRKPGPHCIPALEPRACLQPPPEHRHPLAHAGQPPTWRTAVARESRPLIGYLDLQLLLAIFERDLRRRTLRVLHRIRERFLQDAVGRDVDARRYGSGGAEHS